VVLRSKTQTWAGATDFKLSHHQRLFSFRAKIAATEPRSMNEDGSDQLRSIDEDRSARASSVGYGRSSRRTATMGW
jgi:hypothetical protein